MMSDFARSREHPDLSRATVLVVDHDAASIHLLEACLQPFGARVVSARAASEARRMLDTVIPHIVICDLALPDQNGLEFIRWLRARTASQGGAIPAIAVTSHYERFGVAETRAAGFDMYVRKPIDPLGIVHAVTGLVAQQRPS
jgi:CheY-like chemotaxis protein